MIFWAASCSRGLVFSTISAAQELSDAASLAGKTTIQSALKPYGGRLVQGGHAIIKDTPMADVLVDGVIKSKTSKSGFAIIGFDRDSAKKALIEVKGGGRYAIDIAPTNFDVQAVNGLPQNTVTPTDPALLARIKRETALKNIGFASRLDADWFKDGFRFPLKSFVTSGRFGNQRILNGTPKSPHYGYDMAAPNGTAIYAPQKGLVTLAAPDLFYEGGLTLIDHGQGLISMYLHQSKLLVKTGDSVTQGQKIGLVGAKGRATGPHLCWRLKWRETHLDPSLMVAKV